MSDSKESDLWDLGRRVCEDRPIKNAAASAALWLMHEDLGALLRALGMGDHARSQTPHEVMEEAIRKAAELRAAVDQIKRAVEGL